VTAKLAGHVMWLPNPLRQRLANAYDLVDGRYELVADSDSELVLSAPFETKLPIRGITP